MSQQEGRVLVFEVAGVSWALPVGDVLEVAELGELAGVPTLPRTLASVTTHRGDALPVVSPAALLEVDPAKVPAPARLLVIGSDPDEPGVLGLPVDRVLGLAQAPRTTPRGGVVRARSSLDGRMLRVLDAARLLARAEELIAGAAQSGGRP